MVADYTFVICALGGDSPPLQLPDSAAGTRTISGGERTLYEIACGLASLGHDVELRGELDMAALDEMAVAARARPRTGQAPRRPRLSDVVILPEGLSDPALFATVALSEARGVIALLGPTGLCGWPFTPGWSLPDSRLVEVEELNRAEHFGAMTAAGFMLWSNSAGIAQRAEESGSDCSWIGTGQPVAAPSEARGSKERSHDVVVVGHNRWVALAREVLASLQGQWSIRVLEHATRNEVVEAFADARVLLLPTRVEGSARMTLEARSVGCIPACLDNPFGVGFSEADGVLVASSTDRLATQIDAILGDTERLERMSEAGSRAFKRECDWPRFVARLDKAARATTTGTADNVAARARDRYVRAAFGQRLYEHLERGAHDLDDARRVATRSASALDKQHREHVRLTAHVDELTRELRRIHASRGWRILEWIRSHMLRR